MCPWTLPSGLCSIGFAYGATTRATKILHSNRLARIAYQPVTISLVNDPGETTNLVDPNDPGYREIRAALESKILQQMKTLSDPAYASMLAEDGK